jgi:GT2 family glycosyltransferase
VDALRRAIARVRDEPGLLDRLRAGIGPEQTIEDDVASVRARYEEAVARRAPASTPAPHPAPTARLAAVVLNYRTPDDTFLAVRSLLASRRLLDDIIVVDNDESDGEGPDVARGFQPRDRGPRAALQPVTYLCTGQNLGFSGGVNVGIRAALERGADAVLLVNSDVILPPDCVQQLERALARIPRGGIVGPVVAARSAPAVAASLGMSYNTTTGRMRHQGVGERLPLPFSFRGSAGLSEPDGAVDAVSACAMLISREVFDAIGLFDEDYFFSFEDLDFCLRATRAGFATVLENQAVAYHEGSRSIGAAAPERLYFAARNHLLLASRITPAASAFVRMNRTATIVALNLAHAVRCGGGSLTRRIGAVVRGTHDYFGGRYGPG